MQNEQLKHITEQEIEDVEKHGAVEDDHRPSTPKTMMKMDLHCHTEASWDCSTALESIPDQCRKHGIRVQAITDHDEIEGAVKLKQMVEEDPESDLSIIVGEEIMTSEGEIIGLFLKRRIEPGLSPEETVQKIHEDKGLALLPHGFDPYKRFRLRPEARERIKNDLDIIETFNARVSRPRWNEDAVQWAKANNVVMSAGSDAHRLIDIGAAWVEVPKRPIHNPEDLMDALEGGIPVGDWTNPVWAFVLKMWGEVKRRLKA